MTSPNDASATPAPTRSEVIGYWDEGWEKVTPPTGANLAIAFMGYSDFSKALESSAELIPKMVGKKFLCLGGGNETGGWSQATLQTAIQGIEAGQAAAYDGLAFDVEVCTQEGLAGSFSRAFSAARARGLEVLVTISHSEPYGCKDAKTLMRTFLADPNIDYLSPELYTTGEETRNDYTAVGTPWSAYAGTSARIVPSIVRASMYPDAQSYFSAQGVTLGGFVQWDNRGPG